MRESEWDTAVREPLALAAPDARVLVLVGGEAGTGKSWFVRWLLAHSELGRAPRLNVTFTASGACVVREPAYPKGTEAAVAEAGPVRRPGGRLAAAPAPPWPGTLTASSLGELAASLDTGAPVLLVAEDVHRADERDARALRTVLAHPPAGLRAVLTYRPEELARPGLVLGAPVGYPAELSLVRLRLRPLGEVEVRRMAMEALGEDRCSQGFIARLHERSGGNAQVVSDLVAEVKTAAGLRHSTAGGPLPGARAAAFGQGRLTARDVDEAAVPERLTELVVGRMAALDEEPRRVVWAAAVLDEAATEDELTFMAGLSAEGGRAALTAALSEAVLNELGLGRYGFRVPMEATAVHQLLPGPVRRQLHDHAAEALAARRPVPWVRLARQQLASGRIADWLQSVENAAREAIGEGDHQSAISLLEDTLAHPGVAPSDRARLALLLAHTALKGLRSDQTVEVLRRVVDDPALPTAARGEIRLNLGSLMHMVRRSAEARAELERAAEELHSNPVLAARAMSSLGVPYWPGGSLAENLAWLARAEATAAGSGDRMVQAKVAVTRMTVVVCVGDPDGWRHLEQLPRESDDLRILHASGNGLSSAANAAVWLGEYARSRELQAEAMTLAARSGASWTEQFTQATSLVVDMMTGRRAGLAARARAMVAETAEMPAVAGDTRLVLGLLALAKGEWGQADTWLSGPGLVGEDGAVPLTAAAAGGRIRLAMARQDLAGAAREAAEAWARLRAKAVWVWAAELAPWAVEATARAGNRDAAREMVEEFAAGMEGRQAPAAYAALMWCRAVLAEADGDFPEAADCFRRARIRYQALPRPYEAALAAEACGRCAVAGGPQTAAGVSELAAAAHELEVIGATWDVARVRAELRAHPGAQRRRPRGRPSYGERLSPREEEVAELAGAGLSNREIAATLHLSPRTVEQHVARALRKLGAVSRQDLAVKDRKNSEPES
ncbi:LuxR C-terminal-related transcriptional regulator [Streptomyces sp. NPDC060064]|uniref:LuxR C-terminal-related transcriptional regulator n=1 Tax=Streptomyces sp. NPDC060064 TaxID=3347049 RepID=UPI00368E62D6